jgi:hypothetical protein
MEIVGWNPGWNPIETWLKWHSYYIIIFYRIVWYSIVLYSILLYNGLIGLGMFGGLIRYPQVLGWRILGHHQRHPATSSNRLAQT